MKNDNYFYVPAAPVAGVVVVGNKLVVIPAGVSRVYDLSANTGTYEDMTMPRTVRNFWIDLTVDGSTTCVETGPRSKDGGFHLTILQRDKGSVLRAMEIDGRVMSDGRLKLTASNAVDGGISSISVTTDR